ncbi:VanW family protein [Prauserella muralis]|uniref:Vanomycin resistance protein VanB n=1 Tax=Prauserella muralis TaxID=588067 RepID=A0A2V4AL13_9PSEU|nr:VanW family protein [Prauserella muralis]PXY20673.1 vanomycin resistance protein VanB [Prauserella muralis]TWE29667.1 vancomycin resistance protein YoaR [Prauserella muralis]
MPHDQQWPESHAEQTDVLPAVPAHPGPGAAEHSTETTQYIAETARHDEPTRYTAAAHHPEAAAETTQYLGAQQGAADVPTERIAEHPGNTGGEPGDGTPGRNLRKPALIAAGVFGALVLAYGADLLVTSGDVPRGVTVAGVEVGGLSHSQAEDRLRQEIEPRMNQPVSYTAGDVRDSFDPKAAGLALDWPSTLEQAGDQPLNPITRITSFFTTREVGVVTQAEPNQLENAMAALQEKIDHEPVEGNVVFEGARPVPVEPKDGQQLDVERAQAIVLDQWAAGRQLTLPVKRTPVTITSDAVKTALEQVAQPAVSAPVVVHGEGADGTLEPEEIAAGLHFKAENGALVPEIDRKKIVAGVGPELAHTEKEGKDAEIVFEGGQPTVVPSEDGNKIRWDVTLKPLLDVLKRQDNRELTATYVKRPAKITTEDANKLGIKEVIGEFTTGGFASDSGVNIRQVAAEVDGAIVKPGETFSLNGHTGPRTEAQGYIPAGIIEDGAPGKAVGGGISQFATTLYNAAYFAGMTDAGHQEHSYYISRYPEGREATVFQSPDGASIIDLKFTNDSPTGVAIQTIWTPSDITVRLWGTTQYEVESVTGPRTNFVQPEVTQGPRGECSPSEGAPGFTVTNTRILKDPNTGAVVRQEPRTVRYNPQNKVVCGGRGGD